MNLTEALPKEIARVRETVLPVYERITGTHLAVWMMRADIDLAEKAMASNDAKDMQHAYEALQGWVL